MQPVLSASESDDILFDEFSKNIEINQMNNDVLKKRNSFGIFINNRDHETHVTSDTTTKP